MKNSLSKQIGIDLKELCVNIGERPPGSEPNRQATAYVARRMAAAGFEVRQPEFNCLDWECGDIALKIGDQEIEAHISPYSRSCEIRSLFKVASTIDELTNGDYAETIMVLHGELCREQLAAKNFVFYNPDHHKQIIALLEQQNPRAIIAITGRNPELTGALHPFPLIEDGDFAIPSAYISEEEGVKILNRPGEEIYLCMESSTEPTMAFNVIGTKRGRKQERILFCAHIDTKKGTPGAVDNGGGVCLLLAMADLLRDYYGKYTLELLAVNGEDNYAYPGGMNYLAENRDCLEEIMLVINSDGAGSTGSRTTYCTFNASESIRHAVALAFTDKEKFAETEPWYQSDHAVFAVYGRPAVALTTEAFREVWSTIAHTDRDTVDVINPEILAEIALVLQNLVSVLNADLE